MTDERAAAAPPAGAKTVLLIEDNPGDARLIHEMLSENPGFSIRWAKKLSDGLDLVSSAPFDVVLLDLSLPDSSGYETINKIRRKIPMLPLIVLTGLNDETVGLKAVQEGAQDYLVKGTVDGPILSRIIRYAIERKKNEEALLESREKLTRKNREILEFTENVTHDLKKPLSTLKIVISLMNDPALSDLSEKGREAVQTGKEAVLYMQEILDDLLTLARMEAGSQKLEKENIEIADIIQTVLDRLKYDIEEKRIHVSLDAEVSVLADRKSMHKLFMNLIGNAVNYMGDGKTREISIKAGLKGKERLFQVRDTGMGIPAESQKEIFDKFKRGKNAKGINGTGLGLSIVKSTVEAHEGKIWFESKEGEGTTFYFTLPDAG